MCSARGAPAERRAAAAIPREVRARVTMVVRRRSQRPTPPAQPGGQRHVNPGRAARARNAPCCLGLMRLSMGLALCLALWAAAESVHPQRSAAPAEHAGLASVPRAAAASRRPLAPARKHAAMVRVAGGVAHAHVPASANASVVLRDVPGDSSPKSSRLHSGAVIGISIALALGAVFALLLATLATAAALHIGATLLYAYPAKPTL